MRCRTLFFLTIISCFSLAADTLVVTGSRISRSLPALTRQVQTITAEEIACLPVHSVADILGTLMSADLQQRGAFGMQADIGIRGATFEQVLVLVDGVRYNNSQTGHLHLDLPVSVQEIERIEVLLGPGSAVYGPDAFGGVVNIITGRQGDNKFRTQAGLAEYGTYTGSLAWGRQEGRFGQGLNVEKKMSDGYRYDTGFDHLVAATHFSGRYPHGRARLTARYQAKDFGAFDFYTPGRGYASREQTASRVLQLDNTWQPGRIRIGSRVFYRQHHDEFTLDRLRPQWYFNEHTTGTYGIETQAELPLAGRDRMAVGAEIGGDAIESSQLGRHWTGRYAGFAEVHARPHPALFADLGARLDRSNWGTQFSPSLGLSVWPTAYCQVRASAGRAFRSPSFTELYYQDPYNRGDENLMPEEALCGEAGVTLSARSGHQAGATLFARRQRNTIDWVGQTTSGPWQAANIGQTDRGGVELSGAGAFRFIKANLAYTFMASRTDNSHISKYALRFPRHHLCGRMQLATGRGLTPAVTLTYKSRPGEGSALVVNGRLSYRWSGSASWFAEGTNLLDTEYEEVNGVPMPPRWVGTGAAFSW